MKTNLKNLNLRLEVIILALMNLRLEVIILALMNLRLEVIILALILTEKKQHMNKQVPIVNSPQSNMKLVSSARHSKNDQKLGKQKTAALDSPGWVVDLIITSKQFIIVGWCRVKIWVFSFKD